MIRVRVDGFNLNRFVNHLLNSEIFVSDLKIRNKYLSFCIYENEVKKLSIICQKENKNFEILSRFGVVNLLKNLKFCFGFALAFIVVFVYLFSFHGVIVDLKIRNGGDVVYDMSKVKILLKENGVFEGNKSELSSGEIEKILMSNLDDIYGCTVIKNGTSVDICVYPEIKNNETKSVVISKFDAVITELEVFSGTAKFKIGDVVKSGEILIEDNDQASGKVVGKVYLSSTEIFCEKRQNVVYTGNYFVNRSLSLFAKNIYKQRKSNKYSHYLTKKCVFYIFDNLFIPIVCEEEFVFEVEFEEEVFEFEKYEENVKNGLLMKLKNENEGIDFEGAKISYSVVRDGDFVRVDCYVEIEMEIA